MLNAGIILSGQQPDIVNALSKGTQAAAQTNQVQRQNALANLYQEQGPGILAGNQDSLNALARHDPNAALGVQGARLNQTATQTSIDVLNAQERRTVEQYAASKSAAEAAAEAQKIEQAVQMGMSAQSPEQWDALVGPIAPDLVGQYENRQAHANRYMEMADILKQQQGPDPKDRYRNVGDNLVDLTPGAGAPPTAVDFGNGTAPVVDPEDVRKFRNDFTKIPAVKAFSEQSQAYGRIIASAQDPSPAGDLALIFNYMKVLDPGSVVRESEFATAESATAWLQESEETGITVPLPISSAIRRMATGQRLAPEQRIDFVNRAGQLYNSAERNFSFLSDQYKGIAERLGYSPENALIDFRYQAVPEGDATGGEDDLTPEQIDLFNRYKTRN